MTTAYSLARKVVAGEVEPKVLLFGFFNTLSRWLRTGSRRFEFERLYGEHADPWDYRTSAYEHAKYARTLETLLTHRRADRSALELGCSIGQFSGMLANQFEQVTSVDFSQEALAKARSHNAGRGNLRFVRQSVERLALGQRYDVITCAEMLYYIDASQADNLSARLRDHLAPGGIVVTVRDLSAADSAAEFGGWEGLLAQRFRLAAHVVVNDPPRPYGVWVFTDEPA